MKKVFSLLVMTALCAATFLPAFVYSQSTGQNPSQRASDASQADSGASEGRYTIEFHQFDSGNSAAVRGAGGRVVHEFPEFAAVAARLPEQALRALQNNPRVKRIEVDARRYPMQTTPLWSDV